jgi:hypothetical protein
MLVDVRFLLFALLLLWFPRQWMRLGIFFRIRRAKRGASGEGRGKEPWVTREAGDPAVVFRAEFLKIRNYVDLLRGVAGSLALMGGLGISPCLTLPAAAGELAERELLTLKLGILLVGLVIQMLRFERGHFMFFAPIFFLCGISVGLIGLKGALFAFVMIWAINPMLGGPLGFLSIYALLMLAFGLLFLGLSDKLPIVALVYCFLPVLLSLLSRRPLVVLTRKGTRAHGA